MKSAKTLRRDSYKNSLKELFENRPDAKLVKNKYRAMRFILKSEWSNLLSQIEPASMENFLQDVTYVDRLIRKETEGVDQDIKDILEEEKQEELGYGQTP